MMVSTFAEAATVVRNTITSKYPQINRALIFGSFAEDTQTAKSDLDILVEINATMGLQFISMIKDIEDATGKNVDVITFKQAYDLEKNFGYEILKKARPIYERAEN